MTEPSSTETSPLVISTKQEDADATWDKTVEALKEIGLKTNEAKADYAKEWRTGWEPETL